MRAILLPIIRVKAEERWVLCADDVLYGVRDDRGKVCTGPDGHGNGRSGGGVQESGDETVMQLGGRMYWSGGVTADGVGGHVVILCGSWMWALFALAIRARASCQWNGCVLGGRREAGDETTSSNVGQTVEGGVVEGEVSHHCKGTSVGCECGARGCPEHDVSDRVCSGWLFWREFQVCVRRLCGQWNVGGGLRVWVAGGKGVNII